MNGIKGYISIREASYRWGVSERQDKHLADTPLHGKHPQKGSERYGLR